MSQTQHVSLFTTQSVDNYTFLQIELNELYIQAIQAEKYATSDSQSSLVKMRLFVELACHELGRFYGLKPPVSGDLINKIKQLEASGKVDDWVIESMNTLRHLGNQSVHISESHGHFVAQITLSHSRMCELMQGMHEIAKYVAGKVLNIDHNQMPEWQENHSLELADSVAFALSGSYQSSYSIAKHFLDKLSSKEFASKQQRANWQLDVKYWSDKAILQGCTSTWLLLANAYAQKHLVDKTSQQIKDLYKKALQYDKEGEAFLGFGLYLTNIEESRLGFDYLSEAAMKGNHEALSIMLSVAYKLDNETYLEFIQQGLKAKHKASLTLDLFEKIKRYEADSQDEVALRSLRSGLIEAEAKKAPALNFFKGYAAFISDNKAVCKRVSVQESADLMVESYKDLPIALEVEAQLIDVIGQAEGHQEFLIKIFDRAVAQTDDSTKVAHIKSVVALRSIDLFKEMRSVKTPMPLRQMLQEAANEGDAQARTYMNSTEGKALLKKGGFGVEGNVGRKAGVKKAKDRKKSKAAKKARRK
ncbi:hypothetical protein VIN01S_27080 [Vibrio inusitatus NBRC 102082]|uniref:DUF4145 domain-containing protein n=1 Tax=Vibrio inusitatus NBRC 102082 TaxID=1219070 RepID=A0A4Y3I0C5_9VIBR|nr:DUF4145 domain-containing protein [Vibrio inusitatus]GEA51904.1 hypothetical protein VIN01S_27080 [Vibrio inusitatus NBRC 102082]